MANYEDADEYHEELAMEHMAGRLLEATERIAELEAELARYQNLRQCPYCDEPNTTTEHAEVCAKNPARKMSHAELIAMNESHQRALNELNKSSYLHAATAVNHPVKVVWEDGSYPPGTKLYVKTEPKQ